MDIEYVVENKPDIVLVTSMIAGNATAVETMEGIFADNPIWQSVEAVQAGRVICISLTRDSSRPVRQ